MPIWKPVVSYEGIYEVSDAGMVRRIAGRILKGSISRYHQVGLTKNGVRRTHSVHVLVLEAFDGPTQEGVETNHKNGIKTDNRLGNLERISHVKNMAHYVLVLGGQGYFHNGSKHPRAKLHERNIPIIRNLLKRGFSPKQIAPLFNVTRSAIYSVVSGRTWSHIKEAP